MNSTLAESWQNLKKEIPNLRIRDAANTLGVSEAELLATRLNQGISCLKDDWSEILKQTPTLGKVMVLTRNEPCVHERKGIFENVSINGNMGLVTGDDIDLRIFLNHWKFGFYSEEVREGNILRSLQFFDPHGEAVFKIYSTDSSDLNAWKTIKEKFVTDSVMPLVTKEKEEKIASHAEVDAKLKNEFLVSWSELKDTHDFFVLLKKYNLERSTALELAEGRFTKKIPNESFYSLLADCARENQEVMIFVGSKGVIQIHTGHIQKLESRGPWFNVLDPEFNLHLRTDLVYESWIVDKPTSDGNVTSVELFTEEGLLILQCFGKRKPGIPQSQTWEKLVRTYWT